MSENLASRDRKDDGRRPVEDVTNRPQAGVANERQPDTGDGGNAATAPAKIRSKFATAGNLIRDAWYGLLPTLGYVRDNTASAYHNLGQVSSRKFNPDTDITSQAGKVILVTGGNSGLGYETIRALAAHGPKRIYTASRNETKSKASIESIKAAGIPDGVDIRFLEMNLSSLKSIGRAADQFKSECNQLNTLVLNAGVMNEKSGSTTEEGYEYHMGANFLGHFYLIKSLLPILQATASKGENPDVRVVSVSSFGYQMSPTDPQVLVSNDALLNLPVSWNRYGASKAANAVMATELARRYPQITSVSLHPGVVPSQLWQFTVETNLVIRYLYPIAKKFLVSEREGAFTHMFLTGADKSKLKNGAYYVPVGLASRNYFVERPIYGKTLWEWAGKEIEKFEKNLDID